MLSVCSSFLSINNSEAYPCRSSYLSLVSLLSVSPIRTSWSMEHKNTSSGRLGSYTPSHPRSRSPAPCPLVGSFQNAAFSLLLSPNVSSCISLSNCSKTILMLLRAVYFFSYAIENPLPDPAMTLAPFAPCSHSVCKIERMFSLRDLLFIASSSCIVAMVLKKGRFRSQGSQFLPP